MITIRLHRDKRRKTNITLYTCTLVSAKQAESGEYRKGFLSLNQHQNKHLLMYYQLICIPINQEESPSET